MQDVSKHPLTGPDWLRLLLITGAGETPRERLQVDQLHGRAPVGGSHRRGELRSKSRLVRSRPREHSLQDAQVPHQGKSFCGLSWTWMEFTRVRRSLLETLDVGELRPRWHGSIRPRLTVQDDAGSAACCFPRRHCEGCNSIRTIHSWPRRAMMAPCTCFMQPSILTYYGIRWWFLSRS